jgi:hypothetical protein
VRQPVELRLAAQRWDMRPRCRAPQRLRRYPGGFAMRLTIVAVAALVLSARSAAADPESPESSATRAPPPQRASKGLQIDAVEGAVQAGAGSGTVEGLPVHLLAATLSAGGRSRRTGFEVLAEVHLERGETPNGLRIDRLAVAGAAGVRAWRFHLAGGLEVGDFIVTRATDGSTFHAPYIGVLAPLSVDLVRLSDDPLDATAVFAYLRSVVAIRDGAQPSFTAGVGLRF